MSDLDTDTGFPYAKQQAIIRVAQACASLSFLGSTVIIVAYFRFKQLRTYSFRLVCWLAVCDIAVNVTFFLGSPSDGSSDGSGLLCYSQGLLQRFFQVALIQWTLLIAQSLLVMSSKTRTFNGDKRMPWNHLWAWGVSVLLSVAPMSTGSFGKTESLFCCVHSGDSWNVGSLWRAIFLVMVFVSMVAIVWAYTEVVKNLNRAQENALQLSLHATTDRNKEPSSPKQQQRSPARTSGLASSTSFTTMSHPTTNREASLPVPSRDQPTTTRTTRGGFSRGQEASSKPKRASRRDSLWKKIILGSIMEGSEESASPDCSRRQGVVEHSSRSSQSSISYNRSSSNGSAKDRPNSRSSQPSIPYDRSSSSVSAKEWLWSASRFTGEALGQSSEQEEEEEEEEEECKNVLWLNGVASPAKPKHLFPRARPTAEVETAASMAALEPPPAAEHATAASFPSAGGGRLSSPGSSLALGRVGSHIGEPLVVDPTARSDRSKSNPGGTAVATPQELIKSRFANGVGRARGYVSRMSSLDMDHGSFGYGNGVVVRGRRHDRAYMGGSGRKMPLGQSVSGATTPMGAHEKHQPTKRAPEKDYGRFISRIKWYPVIYLLTWMVPLISGIYTIAVGQSNASFSLVLLATVTSRLQGLLNFICYGLNDKLKQAWLQDFMYRRAVASCCRALWCCCFGPCYRHEDGNDDGGDSKTDRTPQTAEAEQASSSVLNSPTEVDLADEMEKGASMTAVTTLPPAASETPSSSPRSSMAALYATPHHSARQGRASLAPARPGRPIRKASATRHTKTSRSAAAGSGSRRKRTAKVTATEPAVIMAAAAATARRQRVLAGRVRRNVRRDKLLAESSHDDIDGGSLPGSGTRKKHLKPDGSRKKRHNHRRLERTDGDGRKRSSGGWAAARPGVALSPATPITISMPMSTTAAAVSGRRAAGGTPRRSRQKNGSSSTGIRYLGDDEPFSSSDCEELDRKVGAPRKRGAQKSKR